MNDISKGTAFSAVVWIDNSEARIFRFAPGSLNKTTIPSGKRAGPASRGGGSGPSHTGEDTFFLQHIAEALAGADKILISGPDGAKSRLESHLRLSAKGIAAHIVGVENSTTATDGQIVARARAKFQV